jgi:hypothetical protein
MLVDNNNNNNNNPTVNYTWLLRCIKLHQI